MRIALGMSGGIDSTMTALILKEQGHEVIGVTMTKWSSSSGITSKDKRGCFGPSEPESIEAAKRSAKALGIEHHLIHLETEFKEYVLSYYTDTYIKGKTPNPCVVCNQRVKFGELIRKTQGLGINFEHFATGHYARVQYCEDSKRWQLLRAKDLRKDQSYFLSMLSQEQLALCMFPLGEYHKEELKEFARERGYDYLIKKKESQDFLESIDNSPLFAGKSYSKGEFVDKNGKVLGYHNGLPYYTIGQRKGLGLAGFAKAQYVIAIDYEQNQIVIGEESDLFCDSLYVEGLNWVSITEPRSVLECKAKIRLAHSPQLCSVQKQKEDLYRVMFREPVASITPGQVIAFYEGDMLLGAGFIQ
ncbi:MAG: tRNA 2-thiouridine(34) synthase MnmA [Candidatus Cloacimonetes bacterium]|nr:tRNA 2-thiouridine(34) synthase MnmA [Candidatus Cloacimonadota bacterium]